jgi:hypothetical protein
MPPSIAMARCGESNHFQLAVPVGHSCRAEYARISHPRVAVPQGPKTIRVATTPAMWHASCIGCSQMPAQVEEHAESITYAAQDGDVTKMMTIGRRQMCERYQALIECCWSLQHNKGRIQCATRKDIDHHGSQDFG